MKGIPNGRQHREANEVRSVKAPVPREVLYRVEHGDVLDLLRRCITISAAPRLPDSQDEQGEGNTRQSDNDENKLPRFDFTH